MTGERGAGSRRLLFVAGSAHRLGGLATWLDYLLPGLDARGWLPVLGLVEGPRHHRPERWVAAHPHERWVPIPCSTGTPEGRCRALTKVLAEERPAVALSVNIPDLFPAIHRARAGGASARGLMTVHAIEPGIYADASRFRGVMDGAVATNRLACRLLEAVGGVAGERVFYAPYGVEDDRSVARRPGGGSPLRIGYAGRLEQPQKRVRDLPAIARALDRIGVHHEWMIAGTGPEETALRRGLPAARTTFLGPLSEDGLSELLYGRIDALIITSSWETGPLVAWEAMAAGVAVVASRYTGSGLEGALREGENALLFDVADVDTAARQLARLAGDQGLAGRLAAGGRKLLQERYGRERSLDAWERVIESVLALPRPPLTEAPRVPPATGRLERWAGPRRAETLRKFLGRRGPDAGSAGEWPHSHGLGLERDAFLQRAAELDREEVTSACSPP